MTESAVVYTNAPDAQAAGRQLCERMHAELPGGPADVMVLFASPSYDQSALLTHIRDAFKHDNDLKNLLFDGFFKREFEAGIVSLRNIVSLAAQSGTPAPA